MSRHVTGEERDVMGRGCEPGACRARPGRGHAAQAAMPHRSPAHAHACQLHAPALRETHLQSPLQLLRVQLPAAVCVDGLEPPAGRGKRGLGRDNTARSQRVPEQPEKLGKHWNTILTSQQQGLPPGEERPGEGLVHIPGVPVGTLQAPADKAPADIGPAGIAAGRPWSSWGLAGSTLRRVGV